ncbi:MAG: serine/threonine protein kinase, partial [Myxococcales bacterium]|nr:serine/threonine protein kinase [Myxococcales bacterium]
MSGRVIGDGEVRELHVLMCDARDELAQRRVEDPIRAARRAEILDQLAQRKRSPPTPPQIGRFRIKARLGEGGQAVVYRAHDEALGRDVALKLLRPHCFHDERSRKLLVREARGMARLSHRNVVQVHDTGTHGQQMYIVMALVEGETLSQWLDEQPRSWQEIVSIFEQAGRGLAAAHREELVHRDFKPSNVLIDRETERPLVGDFGLVGDTSRGARKQSVVAGTPPYMSPEQIQSEPVDARSDQFSF